MHKKALHISLKIYIITKLVLIQGQVTKFTMKY